MNSEADVQGKMLNVGFLRFGGKTYCVRRRGAKLAHSQFAIPLPLILAAGEKPKSEATKRAPGAKSA